MSNHAYTQKAKLLSLVHFIFTEIGLNKDNQVIFGLE